MFVNIISVGRLIGGVRSFLSEMPNQPATFTWNQEVKVLNVSSDPRGIEVYLDGTAMNEDGDYMTDEEKQAIVDKVQAIVDEHNNNLTE